MPSLGNIKIEKWRSVGALALVLFFVTGVPFYAVPFLYPAIIDELAWSREQVTLLATFQFGSGAIGALLIGYACDRWGAARW